MANTSTLSFVLFGLLTFCFLNAVSAATLGNETVITSTAVTKRADQHKMAMNPGTGLFLNVYIDTTIGSPDQTELRGQILSVKDGIVVSDFSIVNNTALPGKKAHPSVAYSLESDVFLVAFEADLSGTGSPDIYGAFVSGKGVPRPYTFVISNDTAPEVTPCVSWSSQSDVFAVVWETQNGTEQSSLTLKTMTDSVFLSTATFGVTNYTNSFPFIIYVQPEDWFLVVWGAANQSSDGKHNIYSATVAISSNLSNPEIFTSDASLVVYVIEDNGSSFSHAESAEPYLIRSGSYYLLVWEVVGQSTTEYIAAMYLTEEGKLLDGYLVSIGNPDNQYNRNPMGIWSSQGSIYVILHDTGMTLSTLNIEAIAVDVDRNVLGYYPINDLYTNNEHHGFIAGDGLNNNLVVWFHGTDPLPPAPRGIEQPSQERRKDSKKPTISVSQETMEVKGYSSGVSHEGSSIEPFFANTAAVSSFALQQQEAEEARDGVKATRATLPAFLIAEPILVIPGGNTYTSSSTSKKNDDDGGGSWVGALVALILIVIAILVVSVIVVVLLVYLIYKYRDPISAKLSNMGLPSFRRSGGGFQQFNDEDEVQL